MGLLSCPPYILTGQYSHLQDFAFPAVELVSHLVGLLFHIVASNPQQILISPILLLPLYPVWFGRLLLTIESLVVSSTGVCSSMV